MVSQDFMTVAELRERLATCPDDARVFSYRSSHYRDLVSVEYDETTHEVYIRDDEQEEA